MSTKKPLIPKKRKTLAKKRKAKVVVVKSTYHKEEAATVLRTTALASPHVLSLKLVVDEPVEVAVAFPTVDLLAAHEPTQAVPDGLTLSADELLEQVAEDLPEPTSARAKAWGYQDAPGLKPGATASLSPTAFLPTQPPEDIFAYFDFPETEGAAQEDALIDLDELAQEAVEEPVAAAPQARSMFKGALAPFLDATKVAVNRLRLTFSPPPSLPARRSLGEGGFPLHSLPRAIASFVAVSFLFVLPLHAMNVVSGLRDTASQIETQSLDAASLLSAAAQAVLARDADTAQVQFALSQEGFGAANRLLSTLGAGTRLLLSALPATQESYRTGQALIRAGEELALAGTQLSAGYAAMDAQLNPTPLSRLQLFAAYLAFAAPHLEQANEALSRVDTAVVPDTFRDELATLSTTLPTILSAIEDFQRSQLLLETVLGAHGSKRYLLLFQNNTEIRPTGGFIGSFAEVNVRDGVIEQLSVPGGGSYDLQGGLRENRIAPAPLQLLTARWEFQDGNWFPDFPTSARQLIEFYRDAGGPTVDGVIAVNATFVASLIGLLGPIDMPAYERVIDEENFLFEAQRIVELEYDRAQNRPKAFIGDLAPVLVERVTQKTSEDFLSIFDFLRRGLGQKDIQAYLTDETLQREALARGLGGEVKQVPGDYLMVVDTNLGGGKTDGVIQERVDVETRMGADGSVINTVTISRTHFGIQGLLFTGVNNVDYLRLYVPKGAELLDAQGFSIPDVSLFEAPDPDWLLDDDLAYAALTQTVHEGSGTIVTQEHGKTVFGNWVQTMPGSTSTATFTYKLPFKVNIAPGGIRMAAKSLLGLPQASEYTLFIQKQPGVVDRTTHVSIVLPDSLETMWSSPAVFDNTQDGLFASLVTVR